MLSDSFEQNKDHVKFNAFEHFKTLAKGKKFVLSNHIDVSYGEGWKGMVEVLIEELKGYSMQITRVNDAYGQLEVDFNPITKTHEVSIWRVLHNARKTSRRICVECGDSLNQFKPELGFKSKCRACEKTGKGGTGTWLDKY
ncbi:MAG: hypothetical protein PSV17_13610 [Methylotenera sp.]|uniref:hypothetical protein n=1 Tax=Methylotenera sp. TaxID=2051956 RepID=UPI0024872C8A|nr:hypothetical protein [Methylotenera sp.]MDI1310451.1 hypothetical protein [Methylotenera sp.]